MPHASPITCIDHHSGSELLVTGGYDGRVIASRYGRELWAIGFDDLVNDVRVDPTGSTVAVAVADTYAYVVRAADGWIDAALGPHGDDVNTVRWVPGTDQLLCSMDHHDPTVRVWTPGVDGWAARTMARHGSGVFGIAVAPDARQVATAAEDGTARIWDLASGEQQHVLDHPGDPETIDWSPDGRVVATGCDDGILRIWDPVDGSLQREIGDAGAAVRFVRFADEGARLIVGAYDAAMRVYRTADWQVERELRAPFQWERAACSTGDGAVAVASFGGTPVLHRSDGPVPVAPTFGINALGVRAATAGSPLAVFAGRDDGWVVDVTTNRIVARHGSIVNAVAVSPDGRSIASADYRGRVVITDLLGDGQPSSADAGAPVNSLVWSADGSSLLGAGYDGRIRSWTPGGDTIATWSAHHSPIKSIAWSDELGGIVVAGSSDGTLSAWTPGASAGREVWRASGDAMVLVNAVAVASAAGEVLSASRDRHLRRWDVRTGELIERLPRAHDKSVKAVAVSADGRSIVSGSYDGRAIAWHSDGRHWSWRVLRAHGKPGVPAVQAADGLLLTAGWDGSVASWSPGGALLEWYRRDDAGVMRRTRPPRA